MAALCHAAALPWNAAQGNLPWNTAQGRFVTALCQDQHGSVAVATEGEGIWRWDHATQQYDHI